jgi:hypothetical protein
MSTPAYELCPYSFDALKGILAEKSGNPIETVENKVHSIYFRDYFAELEAKTIIIENLYVDRDFLEDYAAYYVRCFKSYERLCTRLHFFNISITEENFDSVLQGRTEEGLSEKFINAYLGFVVVKRLPETIVGRTCLKTYGDDNGRRQYTPIRCYDANLFGLELKVKSLAFQEQDHVVAACATSALWSAFHGTGKMFQHPIMSPVDITKAACDHMPLDTRAFPNRGLSNEQIAHAIRKVNLEPYPVDASDQVLLQDHVYAYCKLGIPLLLGVYLVDISQKKPEHFGNHAVAVTGYSLGLAEPTPLSTSGFLTKSSQIDKIYAHDDQVGPFSRMELNQGEETFFFQNTSIEIKSNSISTSLKRIDGKIGDIRAVPTTIFIPLYHKIRIPLATVRDALISFDAWIEYFFRGRGLIPLPKRLVWDVYLTTINQFKKSVLKSDWSGGNDKRDLLLDQMPRFLWRATAFCEKNPVIDLLFDATDIEHGSFLAKIIPYYPRLAEVIKAIHNVSELVVQIKSTPAWKIIGGFN